MKKFDSKLCKLIKTDRLTDTVFDFILLCPELAQMAVPGQFAQIRLPGHTLRRPISICGIDQKRGTLRFVFQIRGQGTAELAEFQKGDEVEILAPLGNGFPIEKEKRTLLIGGGIGVPPLLGAAAELGENAVAVLGFRSRESVILENDFKAIGAKVEIATDDGSYGFHGLVTALAERESFEAVFACGPAPMLKAVSALAAGRKVPCYLSLEERMACGIGACLGCAVALRKMHSDDSLAEKQLTTDPESVYYGHVCKDGPVFDSREIVL